MRKTISLLLLLLFTCLTLNLHAQSYSFTCDFEDATADLQWSMANGTITNQWHIGSATQHGGSRSMYVSGSNGATHEYTQNQPSRAFSYTELTLVAGYYHVTYDWQSMGDGSYDYFRVALAPASAELTDATYIYSGINASNLPNGWIALDGGGYLGGSSSWSTVDEYVNVPTAGTYKLAFYWFNDMNYGNNPPAAVDNISISLPSCPTPMGLAISDIAADEATVYWNSDSTASSWIVEYGPTGFEQGSTMGSVEYTQDSFLIITGLDANSAYDVYVKAECDGEQGFQRSISFHTICGDQLYPYLEGFESATNETFPACWSLLGGKAWIDSCSEYYPNTSEGSKSLEMRSGAIVATPYVSIPGNMIALDFLIKKSAYSAGNLQVGFVTDTSDMSSLTILATLTPTISAIERYELTFESLPYGDEGFIIFKQVDYSAGWGSSDSDPIYLDSVYIREIPSCIRPAWINVVDVTNHEVAIRWATVPEVMNYEVAYGTATDIEMAEIIATTSVDDTLTLRNLEPNTTYYIWVRSNCGGETSEWRGGAVATTEENCATFDFALVENVTTSGATLRWGYINDRGGAHTAVEIAYRMMGTEPFTTITTTNDYYLFSGLQSATTYELQLRNICGVDTAEVFSQQFTTQPCGITIDGGNTASNNVPASVGYKYSYSQLLYPASDLVGVGTINGISFRMDYADSYMTRTWDVYMGNVGRDVLTAQTSVPIDSLHLVASGVSFTTVEGWGSIMLDVPFVHAADSNLVIAIDDNTGRWGSTTDFYYHNGGYSIYQTNDDQNIDPATANDFRELYGNTPDIIFAGDCPADMCEAPICAVDAITENSITLVWAAANNIATWRVEYRAAGLGAWTEFETTNNTTSTINNLTQGTAYDLRVGALCGDSIYYTTLEDVTTQCGMLNIPFVAEFNEAEISPCWTVDYFEDYGSYPYISDNALHFGYGTSGYIVLPQIAEDLNNLCALFKLKSEDAGNRVAIAFGSNPLSWASFTMFDTLEVHAENQWETQYCEFSAYQGDAHYVAICALDHSMILDSLVITQIPVCGYPTNLSASNITSDAADIAWECRNETSSGWTIKYRNKLTNEVATQDVPSYEFTTTIANLQSNTEYEVWVYNLCNEDSVPSLYSITFRTECSNMELPYRESFEDRPTYQFPSCWNNISGNNTIVENAGYNHFTNDGTKALKIDQGCVATPFIPIAGNQLAVDFLLQRNSYSGGNMQIGFVTDLADIDNMLVIKTITPSDYSQTLYELEFDTISITEPGYIVWKQVNAGYYGDKSYSLDGIYIRQLSSCRRPAEASVASVSYNQASLNWSPVEGATLYEVAYGIEDDENSPLNLVATSSVANITLSNLESNTTYYAWVRNVCSEDEYSDWRKVESFTTQISCATLSEVSFDNISNYGASVSWTYNTAVGAPATQVEFAWKATSDAQYTQVITSDDYYLLSNLQPNTSYDYRARTICGMDTSDAVEGSFVTLPCGHAIVGDGATTSYLPMGSGYSYALCEMLYPASDLQGIDTIRSFSFNNYSTSFEQIRTISIYMKNTDKTNLNASNYELANDMTLVANNIQFAWHEGWCTVNLTTPFVYDGTSNLIIAIDDNSGVYNGFESVYAHEGSAVYYRDDYRDIDPNSTSIYFYNSYLVPDLAFLEPCDPTACLAPVVAVAEVASNQVTLAWTPGAGDNTWQVEYKLAIDQDWTIFANNITDTFAIINGLQPGSDYQFRVGSVCGDAVHYASVNAFTQCAAISVPFAEDFSGASLSPCYLVGTMGNGNAPQMSYGSLYMSTYAGGYIILPEFIDDMSTLRVMFNFKSSTINAQAAVLVGSNPNQWNSFIPVDTLMLTSTEDYQLLSCDLSSYLGQGHYIAIQSLSNYAYVDDISVDLIPSCGLPSDVAVTSISHESATLTWNCDNALTDKWIVTYVQTETNDTNRVEVNATVGNTFTLHNLLSNTQYSVTISNVCSTGDTITSLIPVVFRTECGMIELPYFESFNDELAGAQHPCWRTTEVVECGFNSYAPTIKSLNESHLNVMRLNNNSDVITPRVPVEGNRILVNFDAMSTDLDHAGKIELGFTSSNLSLNDIVIVDTIEFTSTEWNNYERSFTNLNVEDTGYVVFRNINNTFIPYPDYDYNEYFDVYIDNVTLMVDYGCNRITNPIITNLTSNSVTVSFTDVATINSYTVAYALSNDINAIVDSVTAQSTTITLDNLQSGVRYYAWIRSNCSAGGSPWVSVPSFVTPCAAIDVPYVEHFDSYDSHNGLTVPNDYPYHVLPQCWTFNHMSATTSQYPQAHLYQSDDNFYADSAACLILHSKANTPFVVALPTFATPVSQLQLRFSYRNEDVDEMNGTLSLGVLTNANDTSTFIRVKDYPQTTILTESLHNFALDTQLEPNTNYVIAFRYQGGNGDNYYLSIDNVEVSVAPACPQPEQLAVTNLTGSEVSLSWVGFSSNYNVAYRPMGNDSWINAPQTATNSITIVGLNSLTEYQVKVQGVCGSELSAWSETLRFTTACGLLNVPYSEDFNSYQSDAVAGTMAPITYPNHTMPTCWSFPVLDDPNPMVFLTTSERYIETGAGLLFVSSADRYTYAVMPAFNQPLSQLAIQFAYSNEDTVAGAGQLSLGVMTNPNDTATYINLEDFQRSMAHLQVEHRFSDDLNLDDETSYHIAFRYGGGTRYNYNMGLDNIVVDYAPVCETPTNLTALPDVHTATIDWTSAEEQSSWQLSLTDVDDSLILVNQHPYQLNNLIENTTYSIKVRAVCGENEFSEWSEAISFTTLPVPICDMPTDLMVDNITETSADLSWQGTATSYVVEYRIQNADEWTSMTTSANTLSLQGLTAETIYEWRVQSVCDELSSDWANSVFTTLATPVCEPVTHVAVNDITANSARITWTAGADEVQWELEFGAQGFALGQGSNATIDATEYRLTNLAESTTYDVYVRALCGEDFYSVWSNVVTFTTLSDTPEGIDGVDGNFQFSIYPNPTSNTATISLNGVDGKVEISIVDMNGRMLQTETLECGSDCEKRIDVTGLAQGTYFVRVIGDNINSVRKLIVR